MFRFVVDDDLEMRLLEDRHAAALFALTDVNRAHLRVWLPWLDGTRAVADTRQFIAMQRDRYAANEGIVAGIWWRGEIAGVVGFNTIDWANRAAEIGYWLGAAYQGHGIMTRCCRALVTYAFTELGMNRVTIPCAVGNTRSCAIPRRLGFTHEGVLRDAEWLYDRFVDHNVFAMLAREWGT